MARALVVVDVQKDFCEGGALPVLGGEEVARRITSYLLGDRLAMGDYDLIAATYDWHEAPPSTNGGHFALDAEPDFENTWPVHCVEGTYGAEAAAGLTLPGDDLEMFFKGRGRPDYSGAQGYSSSGESLAEWLGGIEAVDVVGLALDHCVLATAMDLATAKRSVRVLRDLTAPVDPVRGARAVTALQARGVAIETTGMDGWTGR